MTPVDPRTLRFTTRLEPRGPAAAVILDDAQLAQIGGGKKTLPVQVTVNGHVFHGRIARMRGETMIGFSKEVRSAGPPRGRDIAAPRGGEPTEVRPGSHHDERRTP